MRRAALMLAGCMVAMVFAPVAHGAQSAEVLNDGTRVRELPSATSPELGELRSGERIRVSSESARDITGEYWYKTALPSGGFGYVPARAIRTDLLIRSQRSAGIDLNGAREPRQDRSWLFGFRAMAMSALDSSGELRPLFGGEGEFSVNLPFASHGYLRRAVALAASYQMLNSVSMIGGSVIFRIFTRIHLEPEVRLRGGLATHSGVDASGMAAGASMGARYPFSLHGGTHLSGYLDAGGMTRFGTQGVSWAWAGAGLGLHF